MKLFLIFFISVSCVNSNHHILDHLKTINDNKADIPFEIITNYLYKYFHQKQIYFAIASMASYAEQKQFQEDLITKLMLAPRFGHFSFNFLDKIDPLQRTNRNTFNLIFVDGIISLK